VAGAPQSLGARIGAGPSGGAGAATRSRRLTAHCSRASNCAGTLDRGRSGLEALRAELADSHIELIKERERREQAEAGIISRASVRFGTLEQLLAQLKPDQATADTASGEKSRGLRRPLVSLRSSDRYESTECSGAAIMN